MALRRTVSTTTDNSAVCIRNRRAFTNITGGDLAIDNVSGTTLVAVTGKSCSGNSALGFRGLFVRNCSGRSAFCAARLTRTAGTACGGYAIDNLVAACYSDRFMNYAFGGAFTSRCSMFYCNNGAMVASYAFGAPYDGTIGLCGRNANRVALAISGYSFAAFAISGTTVRVSDAYAAGCAMGVASYAVGNTCGLLMGSGSAGSAVAISSGAIRLIGTGGRRRLGGTVTGGTGTVIALPTNACALPTVANGSMAVSNSRSAMVGLSGPIATDNSAIAVGNMAIGIRNSNACGNVRRTRGMICGGTAFGNARFLCSSTRFPGYAFGIANSGCGV